MRFIGHLDCAFAAGHSATRICNVALTDNVLRSVEEECYFCFDLF